MKKAAIITVSLVIGIIIGYLYRDYHSAGQEETKRQSTEDRKENKCISTPPNVCYTGDDDLEDIEFQRWDNFGPV